VAAVDRRLKEAKTVHANQPEALAKKIAAYRQARSEYEGQLAAASGGYQPEDWR